MDKLSMIDQQGCPNVVTLNVIVDLNTILRILSWPIGQHFIMSDSQNVILVCI